MPFNPQDYPEKPSTGGGASLLPIGKHRVVATVMEAGDTVVVQFARQGDGLTRRGWFPTSGGAAFKFANLLRAVGWQHPVNEQSLPELARVLEGVPLEIVVADETYQGKTEARIRFTNRLAGTPDRAPPGGSAPPVDDDSEIPF